MKFSSRVDFDSIERIIYKCRCSPFTWLDIDSNQPSVELYAYDDELNDFLNELSKLNIEVTIIKEAVK